MKRGMAKLWLAGLALALVGAGPALAGSKKATHHAKSETTASATTDDLNAQSLAAAQQGKSFTPVASPAPAPEAAPATKGEAAPKKM
jgi:hypothetical protein